VDGSKGDSKGDIDKSGAKVSGGRDSGDKKKEATAPSEILLLDADRQRNTMLRMKHFKMTDEEIKKAILDVDETKLNLESVESLRQAAPTQEEAATLLAYTGDVNRLGKVERFLLNLMTIPSLPTRLKAFEVKLAFQDQTAPVFKKITAVRETAVSMKTNEDLRIFLQNILAIGNCLNDGSSRGAAWGFEINSTFEKLVTTKGADNKTSILQYIVRITRRKDINSKLLSWNDLFPLLPSAVTVDMQDIKKTFSILSNDAKQIASQIRGKTLTSFVSIMDAFLTNTMEPKIEKMDSEIKEAERCFSELIKFHGFMEAIESREYFNMWLKLFKELEKCNDMEVAILEAEEKQRKKKAAAELASNKPKDVVGEGSIDKKVANSKASKAAFLSEETSAHWDMVNAIKGKGGGQGLLKSANRKSVAIGPSSSIADSLGDRNVEQLISTPPEATMAKAQVEVVAPLVDVKVETKAPVVIQDPPKEDSTISFDSNGSRITADEVVHAVSEETPNEENVNKDTM
jgi:hypothetical protein